MRVRRYLCVCRRRFWTRLGFDMHLFAAHMEVGGYGHGDISYTVRRWS